ncbi:zf-CCCH domain-containing protein [Cephalotus follicularis]|uniref:Zf-CCCH domain-containing protein n=1 Tax=Cephalotus follicularis TaxID=3775 RepID=A0A1Q3CFV1_CEPFO|nr:zf-CCCH domain-containing protein [Cephalotus follicularis]
MPPSSSNATDSRTVDDEEDDAPFATEISDSDIAYEEGEEEEIEEVEEIEFEEEIEEEEIEEEIEGETEEEEERDDDDDQDLNDVSKDMESKGHDRQLGSGSSTPDKFNVSLLSAVPAVGETIDDFNSSGPSNEPSTRQTESYVSDDLKSGKPLALDEDNGSRKAVVYKRDSAVLKVKSPKNHSQMITDSNGHMCHSEIMDAETANPESGTGNKGAAAIATPDHFGDRAKGVLGSGVETKQMDMQSGDDGKKMTLRCLRLAAPEITARSRSPSAETEYGAKRPAIICNFYAKGWCIKGSSCRFLHIKDKADDISQHPERDIAAANGKEVKLNQGSRYAFEKSRSSGFPGPLTSSVGNNSASFSRLSSEGIPRLENEEGQRLHQLPENQIFSFSQREDKCLGIHPDFKQLPSFKDDLRLNTSSKDGSLMINKGDSPFLRNSLLPEYRSSSDLAMSSGNYHSGNPCTYGSSLGTSFRKQYLPNDHTSPVLRHSLYPSYSNHPTNGISPSHRITACSSFTSISPSLNASLFGPQRLFDSDKECHTSQSSLLRISSPNSGSEPVKMPPMNVSGNPLRSVDNKTKISPNDWEPSVPFIPSFFVFPSTTSSPGSQYDPLRDSIDLPNLGDRALKFSFANPGASSVSTSHQRIYGDTLLTGTVIRESNGDKNSDFFPNKFHESVLDNNCNTPGKDSHVSGETVGASVVDGQDGTIPNEETAMAPLHGKDVPKMKKIDADHDYRHQNEGPGHKKDLKLDRTRVNNNLGIERMMDEEVHKESKAMRHFRAAIIDLVKELLKPAWREGNLSKDAHNTIVKKAVDKVLSTLQPYQISSMDSVNQYISSSRPKITKLVEAYLDKYGKS